MRPRSTLPSVWSGGMGKACEKNCSRIPVPISASHHLGDDACPLSFAGYRTGWPIRWAFRFTSSAFVGGAPSCRVGSQLRTASPGWHQNCLHRCRNTEELDGVPRPIRLVAYNARYPCCQLHLVTQQQTRFRPAFIAIRYQALHRNLLRIFNRLVVDPPQARRTREWPFFDCLR